MRKDSETVCVPVHGNKALTPGLLSSLLKDVGLK